MDLNLYNTRDVVRELHFMKKTISLFLLLSLFAGLTSGCSFFLKDTSGKGKSAKISLTYYRFGDEAEVIKPLLDSYQAAHPGINIQLVTKFPSYQIYEDSLINEIAEGGGPDLFSVPNTWIYKHQKKIEPMPETMGTVDQFRQNFVAVADRDLVRPDSRYPTALRIFGIPLFVDTLAVYFNKPQYEDRIPNRGRPAALWNDFVADSVALTKVGTSSGFEVSGTALGRTDNISHGLDAFYNLVLQYGGSLYNQQGTNAALKTLTVKQNDQQIYPFAQALNFFASFARSDSPNYAWNATSATTQDPQELLAFSRGQVSSVFGYSDTYQQLTSLISGTSKQGIKTIALKDIGIAPLPQLQDPTVSTSKRDALASYMFETVSRNSKYQKESWDLLLFLGNKKNQEFYNQKTHKSTSRRDLLDIQSKDPIYGVFSQQVGFASSLPIYDAVRVNDIVSRMIQSVADNATTPKDVIDSADAQIGILLPKNGFVGPGPHLQPQAKK